MSYIKMRTIIRMKDLNLNLSATKLKKRKENADSEDRKRLNKVKKYVHKSLSVLFGYILLRFFKVK
jgi:hypothetical protein